MEQNMQKRKLMKREKYPPTQVCCCIEQLKVRRMLLLPITFKFASFFS